MKKHSIVLLVLCALAALDCAASQQNAQPTRQSRKGHGYRWHRQERGQGQPHREGHGRGYGRRGQGSRQGSPERRAPEGRHGHRWQGRGGRRGDQGNIPVAQKATSGNPADYPVAQEEQIPTAMIAAPVAAGAAVDYRKAVLDEPGRSRRRSQSPQGHGWRWGACKGGVCTRTAKK